MKKEFPFRDALDVVLAKKDCLKKDIAREMGISPSHLSNLLTDEEKGISVPAKFFNQFRYRYSIELKGEREVDRLSLKQLITDHMERSASVHAHLIIIMEEIAAMKAKMRRIEDPTYKGTGKMELMDLTNRAIKEVEHQISVWKPLTS